MVRSLVKFCALGLVPGRLSAIPRPVVRRLSAAKPSEVKVRIYRYNRNVDSRHHLQTFTIDTSRCAPMVLDALLMIKNEMDPALTFRRSCREGICGSCAMNIAGTNTLACLKGIREAIGPDNTITIYPLPHMRVIRDLVTDMTQFYAQHRAIRPYLIPAPSTTGRETMQSIENRKRLDGLYECILCACCSTSCPSYWWAGEDDFLGPAAILQSYRWLSDSRDSAKQERLADLAKDKAAVMKCHTIMNCTRTCPKQLNPGQAVQQVRVMINKSFPTTTFGKGLSDLSGKIMGLGAV